jgi:hypothetical protein
MASRKTFVNVRVEYYGSNYVCNYAAPEVASRWLTDLLIFLAPGSYNHPVITWEAFEQDV